MIPTGEGPLWLSAIRDAFSRRVVAWETSARGRRPGPVLAGVRPGQPRGRTRQADPSCRPRGPRRIQSVVATP
ncbi:hypothetical protein [Streptomyces sp. NPDC058297]|uniref:hypothetical protein n=1 Tax=Streptomyces sp. NPDC058297 TaxID=3346433 RepID=UPI0036E55019